jgi:hypothetical protein
MTVGSDAINLSVRGATQDRAGRWRLPDYIIKAKDRKLL